MIAGRRRRGDWTRRRRRGRRLLSASCFGSNDGRGSNIRVYLLGRHTAIIRMSAGENTLRWDRGGCPASSWLAQRGTSCGRG